MASNALLASKIVILEDEPSIPALKALPSAVCLCLGITQRGPVADRTLVTSFDEYVKYFGGFTVDSDVAIAAQGFFYNGGSFMWVSRTCHFTDLTDPSTYIAAKGAVMLQTSGTAESPGSLTGTGVGPFTLFPGFSLDISINGGGPTSSTITGSQASITDTATYPVAALSGGETIGITVDGVNGGFEQIITASGGEQTVDDMITLFNSGQLRGGFAEADGGGQLRLKTDRLGSNAGIQVTTEGTLNAVLGFPTTKSSGVGNVGDTDAVTGAEIEAIVEAALPTCNVIVNGNGTLIFQTVATGAGETIQIDAGSTAQFLSQLGVDTDLHEGADATPEDTLEVDGKTPGAYTDDITIAITAASSGVASEFNLRVLVNGNLAEAFANLTMGDGATPDLSMANYVETVINDPNTGSKLIAVVDQELAYAPANKRPATGTSAALTGGDDGLTGLADSDFLGNAAGPTGLYCFDQVSGGRLLIVPGKTSAAIILGMIDYAETTRLGSMFCILDCPTQQTAAQMVAWMDSSGLTEYSEYAAIYWPRIKVVNPAPNIFGTDETIAVANSGWIAGKIAKNDQNAGGIYEQPAGIGGPGSGYGVIKGVVGVEDDPGGGSAHEVLEEVKRDLIAPKNINPIVRIDGTPWHIDGHKTIKSTGTFPSVAERRGVSFIEQTIKAGLVIFKHRHNDRDNRDAANRIIKQFLVGEMRKDAFRSKVPAEAFYIDTSDQLNPESEVFAGRMNIRVGLATNKPANFIIVTFAQDTRALQESLSAA